MQLIKAAQAYDRYLVAECFVRSVKEGKFSGPVRSILNELCEFLLIYWVVERSGDFFMVSSTFFRSTPLTLVLLLNWYSVADLNADQLFKLQSKYMELLGTIRTYAVNLVDSFDIRDEALGSVLGCWDGNAYQRL